MDIAPLPDQGDLIVFVDGYEAARRPHLDDAIDPLCAVRPNYPVFPEDEPGIAVYRTATQSTPGILHSRILLPSAAAANVCPVAPMAAESPAGPASLPCLGYG